MKKKQIIIDETLCIGCGACANTCHQGVIEIKNNKAVATKKDFCDGLERCLPVCPTNAISFEEVEVFENIQMENSFQCPSSISKEIVSKEVSKEVLKEVEKEESTLEEFTCLKQWPVQIKLVAENAQFFNNSNLLIAADCSAFAYGNFHNKFIKNHVTLIGCPKLDEVDYSEKLSRIIKGNNIKSVTVVRMEVPCCGGIEFATKKAIELSGKELPYKVCVISIDGRLKS